MLGITSESISGTAGMRLGGRARAYRSSAPPPNATTAHRLDSLEENVAYLNERIDAALSELDEAGQRLSAALAQETSQRAADDANIASRLEDLGVGGLALSGVGAIWLLVGTIMAAIPVEIATAFR